MSYDYMQLMLLSTPLHRKNCKLKEESKNRSLLYTCMVKSINVGLEFVWVGYYSHSLTIISLHWEIKILKAFSRV